MTTLSQRARNIYDAIKSDTTALAKVQEQRRQLAWADVNGEERVNLSSFTVNGQQFNGDAIDAGDLATILKQVEWMLTNSATLSTRVTRRSFYL